jgi:hypothetical protein
MVLPKELQSAQWTQRPVGHTCDVVPKACDLRVEEAIKIGRAHNIATLIERNNNRCAP